MKQALIILVYLLLPIPGSGQGATALFQQGQTQTRYLLQQIAALKVYIDYAQKGYSIAKNGLDDLGKTKKDDLGIHSGYFNSLKLVDPKIGSYAKVAACIKLQADILAVYRNTKAGLAKAGLITNEESSYVNKVYGALLADCAAALDELTQTVASGQLQMTDDERIRRIDKIYSAMQDKYTFVQEFSEQAKLLMSARARDASDVQQSRIINGIK